MNLVSPEGAVGSEAEKRRKFLNNYARPERG